MGTTPRIDADAWAAAANRVPANVMQQARRRASLCFRQLELRVGSAAALDAARRVLAGTMPPRLAEDASAIAPLAAAVELLVGMEGTPR